MHRASSATDDCDADMSHQKRQVTADLAPSSPDPFLIATSLDSIRPDAKSRKFIRRYVTKGKKLNKRAPRRRALRSFFGGKDSACPGDSGVLSRQPTLEILEPGVLQVLHDCTCTALFVLVTIC